MNDLPPLAEHQRIAALALLGQALSPDCRVVSVADNRDHHDAEIFCADRLTVQLRLRAWSPGASQADDPGIVWVLKRGDPTTLRQLRAAGQNYLALSGAARLVAGGMFLDRTDLKPVENAVALPRRVQPFADRNSLIARTLLAYPGRTWGLRELAAEAGVSLGTASGVVRTLAEAGTIHNERAGKRVRIWVDTPKPLLERWFASYSWERNDRVAFHAPVGDPGRFLERLPGLLGSEQWALAMQAGASRIAPHAAWDRVHVYVARRGADLLAIGHANGWEAAPDGRVVLMRPFYRDSVWHGVQTVRGAPVVSTVQLLVDLWHYPLRGREQADHLLSTVFLKDWHDRAGRSGADAPIHSG
jgi:hypothetical protein